MAQIFHRSTNTIARVSIYGAAFLVAIVGYLGYAINASSYFTEVNNALRSLCHLAINIMLASLVSTAATVTRRLRTPPRQACLRRKRA